MTPNCVKTLGQKNHNLIMKANQTVHSPTNGKPHISLFFQHVCKVPPMNT